MKDYAKKNYKQKTSSFWTWAVCIVGLAMFFMLLSRIDFLLFGVAPIN